MRFTIGAYPHSIGVFALFAEASGIWELVNDNYSQVSADGTTVFMLCEGMVARRFGAEQRKTLNDVNDLINTFASILNNGVVSSEMVKLITKEMGSDHIDFSGGVDEAVDTYKDYLLNNEMRKYDRMIEDFLKTRKASEIDFLAHAFERVFAQRQVLTPAMLADEVFQNHTN